MTLTRKKISIAGITAIIAVVFLWQASSLMRSDISSINHPVATPPDTALTAERPAIKQEAKVNPQPTVKTDEQIALDTEQQAHKKVYLNLISQYRLAKLQHQLLEEQLVVANMQQQLNEVKGNHSNPNSFTEKTTLAEAYPKLVYLDHQGKNWNATISINNQYQHITTGSLLRNNIGHVAQINRNGVIISTRQQRYKLNFDGIILQQQATNPIITTHITKTETASTLAPITPTNKVATERNINQPRIHVARIDMSIPSLTVTRKQLEKYFNAQFPIMVDRLTAITPKKRSLDEKVLLQMPASSYTIKLRNSKNRDELMSFAKENKVNNRALCYKHHKAQSKLYTLLYGDYLTKTAAEAALKTLPETLKNEQPNIQKLVTIQEELQE